MDLPAPCCRVARAPLLSALMRATALALALAALTAACGASSSGTSEPAAQKPAREVPSPTEQAATGQITDTCAEWQGYSTTQAYSTTEILLREQYAKAGVTVRATEIDRHIATMARDINLACNANQTQTLESVVAAFYRVGASEYGG